MALVDFLTNHVHLTDFIMSIVVLCCHKIYSQGRTPVRAVFAITFAHAIPPGLLIYHAWRLP
jgi:hypothetical protein